MQNSEDAVTQVWERSPISRGGDEDPSEAALREALATLCGADYDDVFKNDGASPPGYHTPQAYWPTAETTASTPSAWSPSQRFSPTHWTAPHNTWAQPSELDELSRNLRSVLMQHQFQTDSASTLSLGENPLAMDALSSVIGSPNSSQPRGANQPRFNARNARLAVEPHEYSASLVVPSIDRFRASDRKNGSSRGGDEVSSSVLGSDVPTELKLDIATYIHPEGRAWFSDSKQRVLESDVDNDDDDDDDTSNDTLSRPPASLPNRAFSPGQASNEPAKCVNVPIHTVPPASLACRKRLTLTGCRGTKCLRKLMSQLKTAVDDGCWETAWKHTRAFAMCSESDPSSDETSSDDDDEGVDAVDGGPLFDEDSAYPIPDGKEIKKPCPWMLLRPSAVMGYSDFVNMCASCFHRLPNKSVGLPPLVEKCQMVSSGARDLRQLLCDVETILLMCLASKIDLEPSEKSKLKNVVASLIFLLSWHPHMTEAITIIFIRLQNQTNNDCFCSFLSRWTFTTNAVQILFEVFCLLLVRKERYLAFLLVLGSTEHGHAFIKPLLERPEVASQIGDCLPEVGRVLSSHGCVIESLRVPCYALQTFIHDLIVKKQNVIPGLDSEEILLSIFPLIIARPYSDEMLISRGWHYRALLFGPPLTTFEPEKIKNILLAQSHEVETNLLVELEFGARALVTHALPHYLLLASPTLAERAYKYLQSKTYPSYFRDIIPPLKMSTAPADDGSAESTTDDDSAAAKTDAPTDHPVGHLPFERYYRNGLVRLGNCFLENTIELTVPSPSDVAVPLIIYQSLTNDVILRDITLNDLSVFRNREEPDYDSGLWWLAKPVIKNVFELHLHPESGRRAYQIQELMSRLTERFFVTSSIHRHGMSPFEEAVNSCSTHQRAPTMDGNVSGSGHQPSYLQIVKRTMLEHTGCTLGRIDLCYLRLLENYESIYGRGSCFATVLLLCKKRRFEQGVLNVDNHVHYLIICPFLSSGVAGGYVKPELAYTTCEEDAEKPLNLRDRTNACTIANDIFPTLLPVHVAKQLPAWLAGRALQDPPRKNYSTSLIGWKILGLELNIAASQVGQSGYGLGDVLYAQQSLRGESIIDCLGIPVLFDQLITSHCGRLAAPHVDHLTLMMLILLYSECGNPRAIHLIAKIGSRKYIVGACCVKLAATFGVDKDQLMDELHSRGCGQVPFAIPGDVPENGDMAVPPAKLAFGAWVLDRGVFSRFILLADIVFRFRELMDDKKLEKILLIYLSGEDLIRCRRVLARAPSLKEKYKEQLEQLTAKYQQVKNGRQSKCNNMVATSRSAASGAGGSSPSVMSTGSAFVTPSITMSYNKDERLKESLAIVKRLAMMDDVEGAIDYFYQLRNSEGGLLDISVGNKILHLCVIHGKLKKAEEILETLRNDAHCEINAIDFIPGSCVRPDVVTCNIIIKGMARDRNSSTRLQEIKDFILHMEKPFHLGGDGVKPDQVTFHAVINAAVSANDLQMTWQLFNMMLERNIKIDSYTCNLVAEQLCKGVAAAANNAKQSSLQNDSSAKRSDDSESASGGGISLSAMISRFCCFVEQNDITNYDDNVNLLRNIVEMYSKKDSSRLKKFLDTVSAKIMARLTEQQTGKEKTFDPQELAVLMTGYGKCGKVNKVNSIWKQLESCSKDIKWTSTVLGYCIEAFATIKDVNMVLQLAERAKKLTQSSAASRPLTATQYSAIIRTCVAHQKQPEALQYYNLMMQYNLTPNEMAYNALIHSCVQTGDLSAALSILNDMSKAAKENKGGSANYVKPDIVTYSTIIKGLCDEGAMDAACELFESLPAKGLVRDSVTYNTILEGYARLGDTKAVERVFGEMMACCNDNGSGSGHPVVRPTCYTLTILVKFYGRKRQVEHVINLVEVLPTLGRFKLDSYVYTAVIAACAWNNRIIEAYNYLLQMRSLFGCGSRTYGTLVSGCLKNYNCPILKQVVQLIAQDNTKLDKREVTALRDLLKQYATRTLNSLWMQSGFNHEVAEAIRQVVNQQRRELSVKLG